MSQVNEEKNALTGSSRVAGEAPDSFTSLSGRERDVVIHRDVMGHRLIEWCGDSSDPSPKYPCWQREDGLTHAGGMKWALVPEYSKDIAAAMNVMDEMKERGYGWSIGTHRDGWFVRCFHLPDEGFNWRHSSRVRESLMQAICETALLALEETKEAARLCGLATTT